MIVNTIAWSCDSSMFGLFRKDEPQFIPTSSCAVNLKLASNSCLYFWRIFLEWAKLSMDRMIPLLCLYDQMEAKLKAADWCLNLHNFDVRVSWSLCSWKASRDIALFAFWPMFSVCFGMGLTLKRSECILIYEITAWLLSLEAKILRTRWLLLDFKPFADQFWSWIGTNFALELYLLRCSTLNFLILISERETVFLEPIWHLCKNIELGGCETSAVGPSGWGLQTKTR